MSLPKRRHLRGQTVNSEGKELPYSVRGLCAINGARKGLSPGSSRPTVQKKVAQGVYGAGRRTALSVKKGGRWAQEERVCSVRKCSGP